jgi:hypothetical protein
LARTISVAKFWGYDPESEGKAYIEKAAEQKHWRTNTKFELGNWTAIEVGPVLSDSRSHVVG